MQCTHWQYCGYNGGCGAGCYDAAMLHKNNSQLCWPEFNWPKCDAC